MKLPAWIKSEWGMEHRAVLVAVCCGFPLLLGLGKTLVMQATMGEEAREAVEKTTSVTVEVAGDRGDIVDCKGRSFAYSSMQGKLEIVHPVPAKNEDFLIAFLAGLLDMSEAAVIERYRFKEGWRKGIASDEEIAHGFLQRVKGGYVRSVTVDGWLTAFLDRYELGRNPVTFVDRELRPETAAALSAVLRYEPVYKKSDLVAGKAARPDPQIVWLKEKLRGLRINDRAQRRYPQGAVAGQVIGFATDADAEFAKMFGREPSRRDMVGRYGTEAWYQEALTGGVTKLVGRRGRGRSMILDEQNIPGEINGLSLRLAIDSYLQVRVEKHLTEAVMASGAQRGIAIVMDTKSGDLLAVAQALSFNPNAEVRRTYKKEDLERWDPAAFTRLYEPGSTLKPLIAGMFLQEGLGDLESYCFGHDGEWRVVEDKREKPIKDVKKHNFLTLGQAIKYSSNICMGEFGLKLGAVPMHEYLLKLRIGRRTGVVPPPRDAVAALAAEVHHYFKGIADAHMPKPVAKQEVAEADALEANNEEANTEGADREESDREGSESEGENAQDGVAQEDVVILPETFEGLGAWLIAEATKDLAKRSMTEANSWLGNPRTKSVFDVANRSFGQGVSGTPIQILAAFNTIANDGVWVQPVLVKSMFDSSGGEVYRANPIRERVFDSWVARELMRALREVVEEGGTGEAADVPSVEVGGKTGTAQKYLVTTVEYRNKDRKKVKIPAGAYVDLWSAWFAGVAPLDDPKFTVLVIMDNPTTNHGGGMVAAPVFSNIVRDTMAYISFGDTARIELPEEMGLGVPRPTRPAEQEPEVLAIESGATMVMVPDFRGLSVARAVGLAASAGLTVSATGSGWAHGQLPAAGLLVKPGSTVRIDFRQERPRP